MTQHTIEKRILDAVQEHNNIGATIGTISQMASISRLTAAKYLAVMEARGVVSCRHVGRAKLYSLAVEGKCVKPA